MANPSAVSGYDDSYADLLDYSGSSYAYLNASSGLITTFDYYSSTDGNGDDGGRRGRLPGRGVQSSKARTARRFPRRPGNTTPSRRAARPSRRWRRTRSTRNTDGTGAETTSYAYTWFSGTAQMQTETVSAPVSTGVYDVTTTVFNAQGQADLGEGPQRRAGLLSPTTRPPGRWSRRFRT